MVDDAPCCGACAHALETHARGGPAPTTAPLLHAPVEDGIPRGVTIVIIIGRELGRAIPLDKPEIVVGRTQDADVCISDPVISRRQCRFVFRDDHVYVEDLQSACGTYVDGEKVDSAALRDGQRVLVGNTIFHVRADDPMGSGPADQP
jgi:pSer/pThr/pTyr-binding forkhead associated (FHA) protein